MTITNDDWVVNLRRAPKPRPYKDSWLFTLRNNPHQDEDNMNDETPTGFKWTVNTTFRRPMDKDTVKCKDELEDYKKMLEERVKCSQQDIDSCLNGIVWKMELIVKKYREVEELKSKIDDVNELLEEGEENGCSE